ncbi:MAG: FkbM family methyltransferase [Lewinellaceae bacterium]|nr:FkbM family methyltransferase [Lewinellaceae bacterium]MCB9331506.1 FkbM family methyltransferase [Lewinellaceae bacterium]
MKSYFKKALLKLLNYIRYNKSYSQDGEDIVLLSFFEERKNYIGFYVDVGAHHPVRFSNTFLFYKKGWRGINIDPTPNSMRPFKFMRRRDINLEVGIGNKETEMTFFCFNEPALNTFDQQVADLRSKNPNYTIRKTLNVPIKPLAQVLNDYLPSDSKIDFLSIDVEGLDLEVLKSNDWSKFRPEFLLVEDVNFTMEDPTSSEIYLFLKEKKYKIISSLKRTIMYKSIL